MNIVRATKRTQGEVQWNAHRWGENILSSCFMWVKPYPPRSAYFLNKSSYILCALFLGHFVLRRWNSGFRAKVCLEIGTIRILILDLSLILKLNAKVVCDPGLLTIDCGQNYMKYLEYFSMILTLCCAGIFTGFYIFRFVGCMQYCNHTSYFWSTSLAKFTIQFLWAVLHLLYQHKFWHSNTP
jgi:hypothetical protein